MKLIDGIRKNNRKDIPIYSLTRNQAYRHFYNKLKEFEKKDAEEINKWQFEMVKGIVSYAYMNVPFYKELYDQIGFLPGDLKGWKDFEKLPFITKEMVKANNNRMVSSEISRLKYKQDCTGGSTGEPMKFLVDIDKYYQDEAFYRYYWEKNGFNVGKDRCVILRGLKIKTDNHSKLYEYDRFWKYLYLDSSYLTEEWLDEYDAIIRDYGARIIQAFPSSLYMLAKLYRLTGRVAPKFDIVFFSSENVYPEQRDYIADVFGATGLYNQYGHSEKALVAGQGREFEGMAFCPLYGYGELVDGNGVAIKKEGVIGELIGTSFCKSMPFIRYKTSDTATLYLGDSDSYMCTWKKTKQLLGRLHEFVYTKDNRKVSICTVGGAHISELNSVIDMQYEQLKDGELIVHVVENPLQPLSDEDKIIIANKYVDIFDGQIECKVNLVPIIQRTKANKKVMLIQHIKGNTNES